MYSTYGSEEKKGHTTRTQIICTASETVKEKEREPEGRLVTQGAGEGLQDSSSRGKQRRAVDERTKCHAKLAGLQPKNLLRPPTKTLTSHKIQHESDDGSLLSLAHALCDARVLVSGPSHKTNRKHKVHW